MYELRDYQRACVEAIWANLDKHCVASLPTGAGKTPVIAELIRRFLEYPGTHVLLLTHKRELIRQNVEHLMKHLLPRIEVGVFCAGLRSKSLKQVTVASVQSLINAVELPQFELILIDEAHLVPHKNEGQYRKLFARFPDARILGVTATPYRLNGGMLHHGEKRLFDALVFEAKTGDLIEAGWLSNVRARAVSESADLSRVHVRAGEFKPDEMARAMDRTELTEAAVRDVLIHAADRKSILVFCAGVEHAEHVEAAFRAAGECSITTVTEKTSMTDRDTATEGIKSGKIRILCNCAVYTTGFDAHNIDCIVLLRATKSAGLYVQCVGRGLRKAEGKEDCLLLDYGGNIERHGPLDTITAQRATSGGGPAPVKTCPQCATIQFSGRATCEHCGYVFPVKRREITHDDEASDLDPISGKIEVEEIVVKAVTYDRHIGRNGKPDSMRVDYQHGLFGALSEWVCPLHHGYAQVKAQAWFARRGITPMPRTIEDAIRLAKGCLLIPGKLSVKTGGRWPEIVAYSDWRKPPSGKDVDEPVPF